MKKHWLYDTFLYVLGLCFNIALLVLVIWLVNEYAFTGFATGQQFAAEITAERPDREVEFVLEEDTPAAEVAAELEEMGVIANQYLWRIELFLKGSTKVFKAGTYTLNANMNNTEVNVTLRAKPVEVTPDNIITIPEGYSTRDIATLLEDKGLLTAQEFLEACETLDMPFSFIDNIPERVNRLEGYLFPDTYFLTPEPDAEEIIYKMLARFDEIFTYQYRRRADELGLTLDQVVTMASVIEEEVSAAEERPKVSQVIYNRLEIGMALQMDSTVQYALDKRKDRLLYADLEVDSPYNTYKYPGLPVGPITNPGVSCIEAALYPEESDLLYYVLQDEETGLHYFTDNIDDFNAAAAQYRASIEE